MADPHRPLHVVSSSEGAHRARGYSSRRSGVRRSGTFDVAPEGAAATPSAFKGYTLGAYAPNNVANSPTGVNQHARGARSPSFRRKDGGSFALFDEIELRTGLSADYVDIERGAGAGAGNEQPAGEQLADEDGAPLCGVALLGPCRPLIGATTLKHVGWSSILLDSTLMAWRAALAVVALVALLLAVVQARGRASYFLPFHAMVSVLVCARLLVLAARHRAATANAAEANTMQRALGVDALLYQGAVTIGLYAALMHLAAFSYPAARAVVRAPPRMDAGAALCLLLAALLLLDVIVTPIAFRLPYVPIVAIYAALLCAVGVRRQVAREQAAAAFLLALGAAFAVGLAVTLYARAVYLLLHRERICFALRALTPAQVQYETAQAAAAAAASSVKEPKPVRSPATSPV